MPVSIEATIAAMFATRVTDRLLRTDIRGRKQPWVGSKKKGKEKGKEKGKGSEDKGASFNQRGCIVRAGEGRDE